MPPALLILSSEATEAADKAVSSFADFMGVNTERISVSGSGVEAAKGVPPGERSVAVHSATLKRHRGETWFHELLQNSKFALVYGFAPASDSPELKWLTRDAVTSVVPVSAQKKDYSFHARALAGSNPISGRSYSIESPAPACAFAGSQTQAIISVNGQPCFLSIENPTSTVFILAEESLLDINQPVTPDFSVRDRYFQFLALGIFLRTAFGDWCWTNPHPKATVTIDDPPLKQRYGFVRYDTLLPELQRTGCALTIGFIPYNYRRSDPRVVSLVRRHSDQFSITIHGCDHTGDEFASRDERWLNAIANCARARMESHHQRTQMPYDDVMIFPQGRFSTTAMNVLKECRYVAAVNSSPWAVDVRDGVLTARDLLEVAITRYGSFPLFVRRYPRDAFDFAFDAFFQKPLLMVEHHGYFKDGYAPFASFIGQIGTLAGPRYVWTPLRKAVTSSCIMRQIHEGNHEVKFFTPYFQFRNPNSARGSISFVKSENADSVAGVFANGQQIPHEFRSDQLRCELQLDPGEEIEFNIKYREVRPNPFKPSLKYRGRVFARRLLSDVRDNYLSRSAWLTATAERAKDFLRNGS